MSKEIIAGDGYVHPVKMGGDTNDIIKAIMDADKCNLAYIGDVSGLLGPSIQQTCQNIYQFVRSNIVYNEDEDGVQWVQSPGELWSNRYASKGGTGEGGDCKSMSIFCGAILKKLGNYNWMYRFVSEEPDEELYHVYLIVMDDTGQGYITLDCTLNHFNRELAIAKCMDVDPAGPEVPCPFTTGADAKVGAATTAEQRSGDIWNAFETNFADTCANNGAYHVALQAQCINEIKAKFNLEPVKKAAAVHFITDNWDNHLKSWALMIYQFWGDARCNKGDFAVAIPPAENADIWLGTGEMSLKIGAADNFYKDLTNMGLSSDSIFKVTQLSVYNNHGITLDYMLYRCYNKLTYGQEWGPVPGIPYYDSTAKTFYPNGASADTIGNLLAAMPLNGIIGIPWGTPYVAIGIFIMSNGATDADIKALTDQVNIWGWSAYINNFIFPGGTITYTPSTSDKILAATTAYYNWQQGNLPVMASNLFTGNTSVTGPRVGQVQLIIGLVVAIISAVVAIITAVLKFISTTQSSQAALQANPSVAPVDFKLQYQSADGCAIGYTAQCTSGVAKVCQGQPYQCNPNLQLPANMPANSNYIPTTGTGGPGTGGPGSIPGLTPGTTSSNTLLYLGLGALALGVLTSD